MSDPSPARLRPRLSRTFSRARWGEYRRFLVDALDRGYSILSLEDWVDERKRGRDDGEPTLILRHDVDQHPRSALAMASIERDLGLRSSWYFRWRTAHPVVIATLKADGFQVGLHYETLTRNALERGSDGPAGPTLVESSRRELRAEIATFARLFGPFRSAIPHGDSRIPAVHNAELLRGQDCSSYGIEFDGNEAMRGQELAHWLTDRTAAEGGWKDGIEPARLLSTGVSPILSVTHPNNWASGPGLWMDRALRAALPPAPRDSSGRLRRPIRTGSDLPPR
jgi:hypothetical protein